MDLHLQELQVSRRWAVVEQVSGMNGKQAMIAVPQGVAWDAHGSTTRLGVFVRDTFSPPSIVSHYGWGEFILMMLKPTLHYS